MITNATRFLISDSVNWIRLELAKNELTHEGALLGKRESDEDDQTGRILHGLRKISQPMDCFPRLDAFESQSIENTSQHSDLAHPGRTRLSPPGEKSKRLDNWAVNFSQRIICIGTSTNHFFTGMYTGKLPCTFPHRLRG